LISLHLKSCKEDRWVNTEGKLNHLNGFAHRQNNQFCFEEYCVDGKRHNPKSPAFKCWHPNSQLWLEEYCIDGNIHNTKGSAYKVWDFNGKLWVEEYWLKGKEVDKSTFKKSQQASLV